MAAPLLLYEVKLQTDALGPHDVCKDRGFSSIFRVSGASALHLDLQTDPAASAAVLVNNDMHV